jgi:hypothetical protein
MEHPMAIRIQPEGLLQLWLSDTNCLQFILILIQIKFFPELYDEGRALGSIEPQTKRRGHQQHAAESGLKIAQVPIKEMSCHVAPLRT